MNANQSMLSKVLFLFGESECRGSSPLYAHLAIEASKDSELIDIVAHAQEGQPSPNMLFGAVHYLLMTGADHSLTRFYRSLTPNPVTDIDPFPDFRSFCLEYRGQIEKILETRRVQTNVVERCGLLYPAFSIVSKEINDAPLSMIEVGTSAGLNLNWDNYSYDYGDGNIHGNQSSPVRIRTDMIGNGRPEISGDVPKVAYRIGLEYSAIDLSNHDDVTWLKALVWPENTTRLHNLEEAIKLFQADPPPIIEGNAIDTLSQAISDAPDNSTICVFHTHTLNQFSESDRNAFYDLLRSESYSRPIFVVSSESRIRPEPLLEIRRFQNGSRRKKRLAVSDPHGKWMEWLQTWRDREDDERPVG